MYAPHRMVRRYLARLIFAWADKKYGQHAENEIMREKWHFWMDVKNKVNNKI